MAVQLFMNTICMFVGEVPAFNIPVGALKSELGKHIDLLYIIMILVFSQMPLRYFAIWILIHVGSKNCNDLSEGYALIEMWMVPGNVLEVHLVMGRGIIVVTCK